MKGQRVVMSRQSDEWTTPLDLFCALREEFDGFALDAAATRENALCPRFFTREDDALTQPWEADRIWLNPPYSQCRAFIQKAADASRRYGATVVCLVPARTDTRWWHDYIWDAATNSPRDGVEVRFIKGRLKFGQAKTGAPFPSVAVVFRS